MVGYTPYETWSDDMVHTATHIMDIWMQHYDIPGMESNTQQVTGDIFDVFMRFRNVDAAAIDSCVQELTEVELAVASHVDKLADAHDRVAKYWSGTAADGFTDYLNAMQAALNNMRDRLQALVLVASAELRLASDFQSDVNALVQKTLQGIEDAEIHQEKMALLIAGSIAAVGAALVAGPEVGPVVVGVLSAMTQGTASMAAESLDADNVYDVIQAFINAGRSLNGDCSGQGYNLITGLDLLMSYVTEDHLPEVRPDRPEIITAPSYDPKNFRPDGADPSKLGSIPTTDLVPEPPQHGDQASDHVGGEGTKEFTVFGQKVTVDTGPARDLYPEQGPPA